jgi:TonB-linked SusC/RagA family outer membrane protein
MSQEMVIGNSTQLEINLEQDLIGLEEVVVIGYGSVKKSDLTGSVTSIDTEQIESLAVNKIGEVLQGRSTGLQIVNSSDDPEGGLSVRIRGASSLKGSREPLVVVDGVPFGSLSDLDQFSPSDIKSVEILKDASAAAIYGSQGANGVILVSTRTGEEGKPEVFIESSYTIAQYTKDFERWTDMELMSKVRNYSLVNDGADPLFIGQELNGFYYPSVEEFANGTYTFHDWVPITMNENPATFNLKASVRGGSDKNRYLVSAGYLQADGAVLGDVYDKVNVFAKDVIDVTKKLSVEFSVNLSNNHREYGAGGSYSNGGRPWYKPFNDDGSYYIPSENYIHPLQLKDDNFNEKTGLDLLTMGGISYKITPWLTFNSNLSYNSFNNTNDYYQKSTYTTLFNSYKGYGSKSESSTKQTYFTNTLSFDKKFADIHDVHVMVGRDDQVKIYNSMGIIGKDFVTDVLYNENLPLATLENQEITQAYTREDLQSYFARANYNLLDKYLFTFTFRADGSSKFGENNKWGYFPAVGMAWKLHNEGFLQDSRVFDILKLRLSAGKTGNQGINPYQTISKYGNTEVYDWANTQNLLAAGPGYLYEGQYNAGIVGIGNPDLKWETTIQYSAAIESGYLNNRLRFNVDVYYKHTTDLLRDKFLASSSGFNRVLVNDGVIDNWGVEFQLGGDIISRRDFSFAAELLFSMNRNIVVDIGTVVDAGLIQDEQGNEYVFANNNGSLVYAIGQPMNSFYGYYSEGPIQAAEEMPYGNGSWKQYGDLHYTDLNDNAVNDEGDRTIIGDPTPDFISSLNLTFKYKQFDLYALFNAVYGNDVLDWARDERPTGEAAGWTYENQRTVFPSVRNSGKNPNNTFYVVDGSFLRLQNLSLGYNIQIKNQNIFKRGRVFCNLTNLFVITNDFEGYDPEVGIDGVLAGGYNVWAGAPRQRSYTFGLNLTF